VLEWYDRHGAVICKDNARNIQHILLQTKKEKKKIALLMVYKFRGLFGLYVLQHPFQTTINHE